MNYLILLLFIFLLSCSSDKEKNLVDVEYYMKQGKEINLIKKSEFKEINKINKLILSKPVTANNWLGNKFNTSNNIPRFFIDDFNKKIIFNVVPKSFLVIKKKIYLVDDNSNIIILDENLKELKRKSLYKRKVFKDFNLEFSMTTDGKLIFISDNLGNIHSIDIDTLKIKWSLKLGVPIKSNLYFSNNNLFFMNTNTKLYSINSLNGEINWSSESASKITKEKYKISINNNLLITNNDYGEIICYDLVNKNPLWKLSLKDENFKFQNKNFVFGYPVISDGILYFSSSHGQTMAIEQSTGRVIWSKLIESTNLPIVNNNYIFLINKNGFFYILNKKTGEVIFAKNIDNFNIKNEKKENIYYNIILSQDYIYFTNSGKNLIKININNLKMVNIDQLSINDSKDYFVLNDRLYILEEKSLSKLYR